MRRALERTCSGCRANAPLQFTTSSEIYFDCDTKIALLSGAPFDDPSLWFLTNDQIARARKVVNAIAGSRRLLAHSLITPGQPGWIEEVDRCIAEVKPDSWKGYTIGDPSAPPPNKYPWRLDDEKWCTVLRKAVKAGIDDLHSQGAFAQGLRDVGRECLEVRDRRRRAEGGKGLAAAQFCDLPRGKTGLPRAAER
jgi:hypothetical protein